MTLSHRSRPSRSTSSSSVRENAATSQILPAASSEEGNEEINEIYLRGPSQLPPTIPILEDRKLIRAQGATQWLEVPELTRGRTPSSVLSCLLKNYHPGIIEFRGKEVVATTWKHYKAKRDETTGRSKADEVEEGFWLRFRFEPDRENEARKHVAACCKVLLRSLKFYARNQAILDHCRYVLNVNICDKIAGKRYLTKQEYIKQQPSWCSENAWKAWATEWSNEAWIARSETNRANRYSAKFKPHKGGSNSIATIMQKLSKKEGREVSQLEAWVFTHRGCNPQAPDELNSEEATACLEGYKTRALELNGPDFDWLHSPVDARALYECSCGRSHGKWATFNGAVNGTEALAEIRSDRDSLRAAKRQREEQGDREKRRQAHDARVAREYAETVLEWGKGIEQRDNSVQKFMETVARQLGMPTSAVPPPLPPLPPAPVFCASASSNPPPSSPLANANGASASNADVASPPAHASLDNDDTFGSAIGMDNPVETLQRIARGVFGGYGNGAACGGGSLDLNLDELAPY